MSTNSIEDHSFNEVDRGKIVISFCELVLTISTILSIINLSLAKFEGSRVAIYGIMLGLVLSSALLKFNFEKVFFKIIQFINKNIKSSLAGLWLFTILGVALIFVPIDRIMKLKVTKNVLKAKDIHIALNNFLEKTKLDNSISTYLLIGFAVFSICLFLITTYLSYLCNSTIFGDIFAIVLILFSLTSNYEPFLFIVLCIIIFFVTPVIVTVAYFLHILNNRISTIGPIREKIKKLKK